MKIEELELFEHTFWSRYLKKFTKLTKKDRAILKNEIEGGSTQCQTQKKPPK